MTMPTKHFIRARPSRMPGSSRAGMAWLLALSLMAAARPGAGAPDAHSVSLTWDDCLRLAAGANPDLAAARADVAAAAAGTHVARADLLPQLGLTGAASRTSQDSQNEATALNVDAKLTQSLYSGGKNRAGLRRADTELTRTESAAAAAAADVTWRLRTAFIGLLFAQEQTNLMHTIRDRRAENLEMVELRHAGGIEHKGSLALSQATLREAGMDLQQALRAVHIASEILRLAMGGNAGRALRAAGGEADGYSTASEPAVDDQLIRATPEYRQALAETAAARADLDIARAGFMPTLDLSVGAGRQGDENNFDDDGWSVGVTLSLPIWSGGRNYAAHAQARAGLAGAESRLSQTYNALFSDLANTLRDYQNAVERLDVRRAYLDASQIQAEIAREQYTNGLLGFENWDTIENNLITAAKRMLETQNTARTAEAAWRRATGFNAFAALKN